MITYILQDSDTRKRWRSLMEWQSEVAVFSVPMLPTRVMGKTSRRYFRVKACGVFAKTQLIQEIKVDEDTLKRKS